MIQKVDLKSRRCFVTNEAPVTNVGASLVGWKLTMTPTPTTTPSAAVFSPNWLTDRSLVFQVFAVLLGTAFLTLGSKILVPMVPVPMTMQTFAVTLVGVLYGGRLGALTVLAWLVQAAAGLPVLAGGTAGLAPFAGPTAGYLFSFPLVAGLVGGLADSGRMRGRWRVFLVMLTGNVLCLVLGAAWLSVLVGIEKAWVVGVVPFVLGGALKSALGTATLALCRCTSRKASAA